MRDLRFRAWNGAGMIYNDTDFKFYVRDSHAWYYNQDEEVMEVKNWPVMQFTGLTDKNGKEIYEGDILRIVENKNWFSGPDIYEAKYKNGYYEYFTGFVDSEVIGNVHENKDLLDNNN